MSMSVQSSVDQSSNDCCNSFPTAFRILISDWSQTSGWCEILWLRTFHYRIDSSRSTFKIQHSYFPYKGCANTDFYAIQLSKFIFYKIHELRRGGGSKPNFWKKTAPVVHGLKNLASWPKTSIPIVKFGDLKGAGTRAKVRENVNRIFWDIFP